MSAEKIITQPVPINGAVKEANGLSFAIALNHAQPAGRGANSRDRQDIDSRATTWTSPRKRGQLPIWDQPIVAVAPVPVVPVIGFPAATVTPEGTVPVPVPAEHGKTVTRTPIAPSREVPVKTAPRAVDEPLTEEPNPAEGERKRRKIRLLPFIPFILGPAVALSSPRCAQNAPIVTDIQSVRSAPTRTVTSAETSITSIRVSSPQPVGEPFGPPASEAVPEPKPEGPLVPSGVPTLGSCGWDEATQTCAE